MILNDLTVSWLKFCNTFDSGVAFVNFDAADDESQLPRSDVIGSMGLTFDVEEHFIFGNLQIGYSTYDDKNNVRLTGKMDLLLARLRPLSRIEVFDGDTGALKGLMVIQSPVRMMPPLSGDGRPLQFLALSFQTTVTYAVPT